MAVTANAMKGDRDKCIQVILGAIRSSLSFARAHSLFSLSLSFSVSLALLYLSLSFFLSRLLSLSRARALCALSRFVYITPSLTLSLSRPDRARLSSANVFFSNPNNPYPNPLKKVNPRPSTLNHTGGPTFCFALR